MSQKYDVDVCIVGGGPAGMVLGLLLAKLKIRTLVLEQHRDFEREYRGEVLMPRFVQMMRQINLWPHIEAQHHLKLRELEGFYGGKKFFSVTFNQISPEAPFAVWMPQPILLNALHQKAAQFPDFDLWFDASARDLIWESDRCVGVLAKKGNEDVEIRAKITVGADGRFSVVRREGKFDVEYEDHRFDIVWFSVPRSPSYDNLVRFFLTKERNYLMLPKYPDLIQCGLVVERGGFLKMREQGIQRLQETLSRAHPAISMHANRLNDFHHFNVLQAKIEFVRKWARNGVLLIGDSAHTCSPAGAIGVSVAVASAIVGAQVIRDAICAGDVSERELARLQQIRQAEVRHIHALQKNFGFLLLPNSPAVKNFQPILLSLAAKSGIIRAGQRSMLAMKDPLPVSGDMMF